MAAVVDANLLVVLATNDKRRPVVTKQFASWSAVGEPLHAPTLIRYEATNALAGLLAARRITNAQLDAAWPVITDPRIQLHQVDDGPEVIRIAVRLQRRSAYDASYIKLAQDLNGELWTLDGPLARNATSVGLPVSLIAAG